MSAEGNAARRFVVQVPFAQDAIFVLSLRPPDGHVTTRLTHVNIFTQGTNKGKQHPKLDIIQPSFNLSHFSIKSQPLTAVPEPIALQPPLTTRLRLLAEIECFNFRNETAADKSSSA